MNKLLWILAPLCLAVLFAPMAAQAEWETVTLGTWAEEPIQWRVLDRVDGQALLLSEYGLTAQPYHQRWREVTWETCDLRAWLNADFLQTAFTPEEREAIQPVTLTNPAKPTYQTKGGADTEDRVFLLSFEEVLRYLPEAEDRAASATEAAQQSGVRCKPNGHCSWWLRTPGRRQYHAACVTTSGDFYDVFDVTCLTNAIRPALWIKEDACP